VRGADVVIGYAPYVDQCADLLDGQEVVRGAMGEELARAAEAVSRARAGARVALVSSGDAGVYGMAARTLAAAGDLHVTVIPGVTAALAAAALVGAPLADDWATLSLSDLHVPWETIERRLTALAASGIALALYNPRSKTRTEPFERALAILRAARPGDTVVTVASSVGRATETLLTLPLSALTPDLVDMRSLVLVAGDTAEWAGEWLIARRG
jgi:precorrin-3B C17-methyltransferase